MTISTRPGSTAAPGDLGEKRRLTGTLGVVLAACLWGTWSIFFRPAERIGRVSAPLEAFVVFCVIFVGVAPLAVRDRVRLPRPGSAWLLLGAVGVFDAMNALFFFWAMQKTTLAVAVLSHYLAPVLISLVAPFVVAERWTRRTFGALGLALVGLVLLVEPWRAASLGSLSGALFGAASAVFFTGSLLGAKRLGSRFAPTEILAWHMPTALLAFVPFLPHDAFAVQPRALGLLVLGGLGPGALAGVLFIRGLAHVEASRASILMLLEPVVAVTVGVVVWHELPGPLGVVGACLVLAAAYLVIAASRERRVG